MESDKHLTKIEKERERGKPKLQNVGKTDISGVCNSLSLFVDRNNGRLTMTWTSARAGDLHKGREIERKKSEKDSSEKKVVHGRNIV